MPPPFLIKDPEPLIVPLIAPVTNGLVTVMVSALLPTLTAPERVSEFAATVPPKVKLPFTLTALAIVKLPLLRIVVPPAIASVPEPIGPFTAAPLIGVLLAPKISEPAARLNPLVKVLAPESARPPVPVLVITPPALRIGAEIDRPIGDAPVSKTPGEI